MAVGMGKENGEWKIKILKEYGSCVLQKAFVFPPSCPFSFCFGGFVGISLVLLAAFINRRRGGERNERRKIKYRNSRHFNWPENKKCAGRTKKKKKTEWERGVQQKKIYISFLLLCMKMENQNLISISKKEKSTHQERDENSEPSNGWWDRGTSQMRNEIWLRNFKSFHFLASLSLSLSISLWLSFRFFSYYFFFCIIMKLNCCLIHTHTHNHRDKHPYVCIRSVYESIFIFATLQWFSYLWQLQIGAQQTKDALNKCTSGEFVMFPTKTYATKANIQ